MFMLGVTLVALAILFSLTSLALRTTGHLRGNWRVEIALIATLVIGVLLLLD
jgi:hypothetical protein